MRMSRLFVQYASGLSSAGDGAWLTIVGIGEDGRAGLSAGGAAARSRPPTSSSAASATSRWPGPLRGETRGLAEPDRRRPTGRSWPGAAGAVCVLATGDPFHYGIGAELARLVPADEIVCYPAALRLQPRGGPARLAAAGMRLRQPARARPGARDPAPPARAPGSSPCPGTGRRPAGVADLLDERGFGASDMTVLEAMGGPRERVLRAPRPRASTSTGIDPLNMVAVEVAAAPDARDRLRWRPASTTPGSRMTGSSPRPRSAPSPSRALAPARRRAPVGCRRGRGLGRHRVDACATREPGHRGRGERRSGPSASPATPRRLGVPDLRIVVGEAPAALARTCPPRTRSSSAAAPPTRACSRPASTALRPGGRLVANAVTLETRGAAERGLRPLRRRHAPHRPRPPRTRRRACTAGAPRCR